MPRPFYIFLNIMPLNSLLSISLALLFRAPLLKNNRGRLFDWAWTTAELRSASLIFFLLLYLQKYLMSPIEVRNSTMKSSSADFFVSMLSITDILLLAKKLDTCLSLAFSLVFLGFFR